MTVVALHAQGLAVFKLTPARRCDSHLDQVCGVCVNVVGHSCLKSQLASNQYWQLGIKLQTEKCFSIELLLIKQMIRYKYLN